MNENIGELKTHLEVNSKSPASRAVPQIPDHQLLRKIGEGSYGEVWLAQNVMGTYRAVKVVHQATFEDDRPYEREFTGIQRFEPISRSHEGLVDVLQVGRNDAAGYFYYVMELADDASVGQACNLPLVQASVPAVPDGKETERPRTPARITPEQASKMPALQFAPDAYVPKTLSTELKSSGRLPVEECLRLAISLAEALGHLHKSGLVHRDIKPSNIIFVGGAPKLADIGLVADTAEARTFVGTEGFIPPEGPGTVQADIYSLGKVMYEMATGKDRQVFPELPTRMGDGVDRTELQELNEVILKACDDASRRYETAEEMLADLALLQSGQSVKQRRTVKRRRALTGIIGAASCLALILSFGFYQLRSHWQNRPEQKAPARAVPTSAPRIAKFTANFDDAKLPEGTSVYGSAVIEGDGGVGGSGAVKLTKVMPNQIGSFLINDLDGGETVYGFEVSFKVRVGGLTSPPCCGWSFCFAADLPNGPWGEGGAGEGLSIRIDPFDDIDDNLDLLGGEAPAIDVKVGDQTVAHTVVPITEIVTRADFVPVRISLEPDGSLDLEYNGKMIYSNFFVPGYRSISAARYGFGARGGRLNQFLDDISVETMLTPELEIARQPEPQTVPEHSPVVIGVVVNNAEEPSYHWRKDGIRLLGATNASYRISRVASRDAGQYSVVVHSLGRSLTSSNALLTVTPSGRAATPGTYTFTTLAGSAGSPGSEDGIGPSARFNFPRAVAVDDSGNVYVADALNHSIRRITPNGTVTTVAGRPGTPGSSDGSGSGARFYRPSGVAVDRAGNIHVADWNDTVRTIKPDGVVGTLAGMASNSGNANGIGSAARFRKPSGVAVDSEGNVYVADFNNMIRRVNPAGAVNALAGSAIRGSTDGFESAARFNDPWGVAVDTAGNVYVADHVNNTIRKITPKGAVATLAGMAGVYGSADGIGAAARFFNPLGVAVDREGNVYVADCWNNTIRKISPKGVVTTIAGSVGIKGGADGAGSNARFWYPSGIAVDSAGNVYVADTVNHTIRKGVPMKSARPSADTNSNGAGK